MLLAREETFGPLVALIRFYDEQKAMEEANASEFGLASYFCMQDLSRAFRASRALESDMAGINEGLITTEVAPFGGVKDSDLGREGGSHGIDEFLHVKYISLGHGCPLPG